MLDDVAAYLILAPLGSMLALATAVAFWLGRREGGQGELRTSSVRVRDRKLSLR